MGGKRSVPVNRWALALAILLALAGCASPARVQEIRSTKKFVFSAPCPTFPERLVDGSNTFAFEVYRELGQARPGNLIYSPYILWRDLTMVYAGARGETMGQMEEMLRYNPSMGYVHWTQASVDASITSRTRRDDQGFRLSTTHSMWVQAGHRFLPEYLDLLAENYDAGLYAIRFRNPEQAREAIIRQWVGEPSTAPALGQIDPSTRLLMTNAAHFSGVWRHPFVEDETQARPFTRLDGTQVDVPTMQVTEHFAYAEGDGYQAVRLSYRNRFIKMILLVPDPGQFEAFEETLDAKRVKAILSDLAYRPVHLSMPKFEIDTHLALAQALSALGMPAAFDGELADFSGMNGWRNLSLGEVLHAASVSVDEQGTQAVPAPDVVAFGEPDPSGPPVEVTVDRPFVFLIQDHLTKSILFVGRVLDPSVSSV